MPHPFPGLFNNSTFFQVTMGTAEATTTLQTGEGEGQYAIPVSGVWLCSIKTFQNTQIREGFEVMK